VGFSDTLLAENETFDARLAYEEVENWFLSAGLGKRGEYRARIVREAIEQNRRGYQLVPEPKVTAFWLQYWHLCNASYPELVMPPPGPRPAGSGWLYLKAKALPQGVCFIHKLATGLMDLSFSGTSAEVLAAKLQGALAPDMQVVQTGKSAVIRIEIPKVDRFCPFGSEREKVDAGFQAAMRILAVVRANSGRVSDSTFAILRGAGE